MSDARPGTGEWHRVEGPGIVVDVPADVSARAGTDRAGSGSDASGSDGPAVTLSGPDVTVILDRSAFADSLAGYSGQQDFGRHEEQIADRTADVISFSAHDGTRVVGTRLGGLTAVVHLAPGQPDDIALRVLRSIRPTSEEQ